MTDTQDKPPKMTQNEQFWIVIAPQKGAFLSKFQTPERNLKMVHFEWDLWIFAIPEHAQVSIVPFAPILLLRKRV